MDYVKNLHEESTTLMNMRTKAVFAIIIAGVVTRHVMADDSPFRQAHGVDASADVSDLDQDRHIVRNIPRHDVSLLDGCDITDIEKNYYAIRNAIAVGAPIFNRGEHATCFVIYERTASELESNPRTCKGVRQALGIGLQKADTLPNYGAKAWAMRDTFDGLLQVIEAKSSKISH